MTLHAWMNKSICACVCVHKRPRVLTHISWVLTALPLKIDPEDIRSISLLVELPSLSIFNGVPASLASGLCCLQKEHYIEDNALRKASSLPSWNPDTNPNLHGARIFGGGAPICLGDLGSSQSLAASRTANEDAIDLRSDYHILGYDK